MKLRLIKVINLILILTLLMPSYTFSSENPNMSDLYVIDSNINESHMFLNVVSKGSSVLVVHNGEDVFQEIYNQVKTNTIENIHIISNGKQSELSIGAKLIDLDYLKKNQDILRRIGSILKDGSDLLLYGCDVAYGKDGREYINTLADLTQLDVAASTNKTGVNNLGGDWKLEYQVGSINTDPVIVEGYEYLLDTKLTVVTNPIETAGAQVAVDNERTIHAFDYDGDGDQDFIGTTDASDSYVESNIYVNDGSGGFGTIASVGFKGKGGYWYEHADVDGDGDLDVFVSEGEADAVYYRNDGGDTFTKITNPLKTAGATTVAGSVLTMKKIDYDSDGDIDFFCYTGSLYEMFSNNGSGVFTKVSGQTFPAINATSYTVYDFDGDGQEDIFAFDNYLINYYKNSNGTFTLEADPFTGSGIATPSAESGANGKGNILIPFDFGADDDYDVIAYDGSAFHLFVNDGNNNFSKDSSYSFTLTEAMNYIVADVDNDGDDDVMVGDNGTMKYFRQDGLVAGTNNRPPRLSSSSPASGSVDIAIDTNIVLTFDETISGSNSKTIKIYRSSDDQLIESVPADDSRVSGYGTNTITINPNSTLDNNTSYYVLVERAAMSDEDGMIFKGLTEKTDYAFTTTALSTYSVTYDANGADSGSVPTDSSSYLNGATVTVATNSGTLARAGYRFDGWNTAANGSGTDRAVSSTFAMGSSNVTLYAKWTALPTYTVTYDANGADSGSVPTDSSSYLNGATVTVATNSGTLARAGYSFDGWNTAANGSGTDRAASSTFAMGSSNVTLYAKWTALSKLSAPTISPNSSTFTNSVTISMNHVTSGASIYFTTDGSTPSTGSTLYSQPVQITDTTTVKAVATMSGYIQSDVITSQYDKVVLQQLPRPTYSPNTLNFTNSVNVQLYSTVSGSAIYYTTDGTTPSSSSNLYSGVVNLTNTTTIKAINIKTGYIDSPILQVLFTRTVENSSNNDSDDSNEGSSNNESENEPTNGSGINGDSSEGAFTIGEIGSKTDKKITVETDEKAIKKQLEVVKKGSVISIPISESVESFTSIFSVQSVKDMQDREIVLEIATKDTLYGIKTTGINIKEISDQVGESVALEKIEFDVNISKSTEQMVEIVQSSADENDLEIVIPPIDFKITARYQDKEVDVNRFNTYMTRKIRVPEGVDSSKITTAIVTEENGRVRHIPTYIEERGGEIFAVVNSLTNSTYTLVYHECTFNDIDGHWAQQSIKNLGDRLIVSETHGGQFVPNEVISRAEFIKVLIKALGLRPEDGNEFIDVDKANDANEYIVAAKRNKLIAGIGQKMFLPMNRITREDVMVIIYNASESVNPFDNEMEINLEVFNDYEEISEYAKPALSWGVRNGLLVGKAYKTLAPKDNITRAELVTIIENYLVKSELINR